MEHKQPDFLEEFGELGFAPIQEATVQKVASVTEEMSSQELETISFEETLPATNTQNMSAAVNNQNNVQQSADEYSDFDEIDSEWVEKLQPIKQGIVKGFLHTSSVIKNALIMNSKQKGRLIVYKDFYFLFHDKELMLLRYTGKESVVIVPDSVGGIPVTSLDSDAFKNCMELPTASIKLFINRLFSNSEKNLKLDKRLLGKYYNSYVQKLQLPTNLKALPDEVFKYLDKLVSVEIPAKVKSIGPYAFRCSNVTRVAFSCKVPKGFSSIKFNPGTVLYVRNEYAEDYAMSLNN